jgi:hypothetical protein
MKYRSSRRASIRRILAAGSVPLMLFAVYYLTVCPSQHPSFLATRAIIIEAKPEAIWPWLAQMGYRRAGFYGYDLIENVGAPAGIRSAGVIEPGLQHPRPGDLLPISAVAHLIFGPVESGRYLMWRSEAEPADGVFTWALDPVDEGHTRLVSRIRLRYHWNSPPKLALDLFTEFADPVAVPEILQGIRDRVEGRPIRPLWSEAVEMLIWLAALADLCVALLAILRRRHWLRAWIIACGCAGMLLVVLYVRPPLWVGAFLVVAATVALVRLRKLDLVIPSAA